ncbi:hypothetical protein [Streptomyces sp. NPDC007905]|uniref:hypothetical protein n=1 Tax=Streptomyces sp. NPDC007905 TaxID=3364788 RepID=UPI0036E566B0
MGGLRAEHHQGRGTARPAKRKFAWAVGSPGENAGSGGVWLLPREGVNGSSAFSPAKLDLPSPSSALAYGRYVSSQ